MAHGPLLHWPTAMLCAQLAPLLPGLRVQAVAEIASTNSALLARARGGDGQPADVLPCLLVAEHQSAGRGRQGKAWQSSAGASLTFSLALPLAPADWSGLSLAVGLALADTLDPEQPGQPAAVGIKWPNDLLLRDAPGSAAAGQHGQTAGIGRKLGGILIETVPMVGQAGHQRLVVVGVGLNLQPLPAQAPDAPPLSWGHASLQELPALPAGAGGLPDRLLPLTAPQVLARVALPLVQALLAFEQRGFAPLQQRFAARDVLAGQAVLTTLPELPHGIADGVDATGTLWLRVPQAGAGRGAAPAPRWPVRSGEVSLRRPAGGAATDATRSATPPAAPSATSATPPAATEATPPAAGAAAC